MTWYCWLSAYVVGYFLSLWAVSWVTKTSEHDTEGLAWVNILWFVLLPLVLALKLGQWCVLAGDRRRAAKELETEREADIRNAQSQKVGYILEKMLQENWHAREAVRQISREEIRSFDGAKAKFKKRA